jgi:hypothetical protein
MWWKILTRESNLLSIVKETDSLTRLVSLKKHLLDEGNTTLLRDSTVHKALKAIDEKLDLKDASIKEILELLL